MLQPTTRATTGHNRTTYRTSIIVRGSVLEVKESPSRRRCRRRRRRSPSPLRVSPLSLPRCGKLLTCCLPVAPRAHIVGRLLLSVDASIIVPSRLVVTAVTTADPPRCAVSLPRWRPPATTVTFPSVTRPSILIRNTGRPSRPTSGRARGCYSQPRLFKPGCCCSLVLLLAASGYATTNK